MKRVLFIPLNSNHVRIFFEIIKKLSSPYDILCYDKICNATHFHTESTLKNLGLSYRQFPQKIHRTPSDNMMIQILNFFKIKSEINKLLNQLKPALLVFAIDHDPISQIFIKLAKRKNIRTILIQEALIRPYEYKIRKMYFQDYIYNVLRTLGIYLNYTKYGTMGCDFLLVGGEQPKAILKKRDIPEEKIVIVGQPKYDDMVEMIKKIKSLQNKRKVFLYIASTKVISDEQNVRFLNKIVEVAAKLNTDLIIKLHPRSPVTPDNVNEVINREERSFLSIVKEGDDTFSVLKKSNILIAISSTVILEALLMNKECIIANYMASEDRLDYDRYDAVFSVNNEDEILKSMENSLLKNKSTQNKQKLLEDELYKLDGNSGMRASKFIDSCSADG